MPASNRTTVKIALPSSLGPNAEKRAGQFEAWAKTALGRTVSVVLPATYEQLAKELLLGKVDAAWAPPFVCARIEAMGVRVLLRGVRNGASTYRAALLAKNDSPLTVETLQGARAVWSDRDSVGGYLLPMAWLREKGLDAARVFSKQEFAGSYRKALEAVAAGAADVTSVFAPTARSSAGGDSGISEVWPEAAGQFKVLQYTDESPNDGVAVSMSAPTALVTELERMLTSMHQNDAGAQVLRDCFNAEKFEPAPRMGYRALYRVALASL